MIPAILSVVFVIYLYQSLKETTGSSAAQVVDNPSDIPASELIARLKSLQSRVEQLANDTPNKGGV